jgi:hypothetical protein
MTGRVILDWIKREPGTVAAFLLFAATVALVCVTRSLVNDTEKTAERQLRAYIQASPNSVFNLESGSKLEAYIIISNSGQTPGKEVERWAAMKISKPLTTSEVAELGWGDREEGKLVSMPHESHAIIRQSAPPTALEAAAIIKGDQRIYVFGQIKYIDVFDEPRTSEFCFIYYGEVQVWPKENGGPGYNGTQARFCEKHNRAN